MAFVTGMMLIDAPASALNNLGTIPGERYENSSGVKVIRAKDGYYPYVSAQAFRYWLRGTLHKTGFGWKSAPIYREEKIAYTDANPIKWWDDDLFGYMRAPSRRESARAGREADASRAGETPTDSTVTRVAPFRVSTLVSIAPVSITNDFGVMARHEGDPVPHEHQFYRTTLKGLFSLDLSACGTFWYRNKTGFRNLDEARVEDARNNDLQHLEGEKAYRLPLPARLERIAALFEGLSVLDGGAKQTLHYTDVSPVVVALAVTKGGNHPFARIVGANGRGLAELNVEALRETIRVFGEEMLTDLYIGWVRGFTDDQRGRLQELVEAGEAGRVRISHPREAFRSLITELQKPENAAWLG